jgi:hypothetical protein
MKYNFIFKEKPVGNTNLHDRCRKEGIIFLIFNQYTFKIHFIKKRKAYVFDGDLAVQILRQPVDYGPGYRVLALIGINKDPGRYYEE